MEASGRKQTRKKIKNVLSDVIKLEQEDQDNNSDISLLDSKDKQSILNEKTYVAKSEGSLEKNQTSSAIENEIEEIPMQDNPTQSLGAAIPKRSLSSLVTSSSAQVNVAQDTSDVTTSSIDIMTQHKRLPMPMKNWRSQK
ncbi:hypothetical protein O181_096827 [Austropuccinia psidii MF-1]|uniref:Uncharacterized protein n=1 Tax=Austropuccinia psidii MF-1 TaxID=1389203 RepID=A0A9Q3J7D0_9BASI|nr:hypothetical protein [Austropuccinia psidii MF-1]